MLKRVIGTAAALALMAPVGVIAASPASAAPLVKCKKPSGAVTFTPGYGATPKKQTTTFNLPIKKCTGKGGVKSGKSKGKTVGKTAQNCTDFAANASNQKTNVTITWNNKKTSKASLKTAIKTKGGSLIATVSGKISKGLFKGKKLKTKVKVTLVGTCGDDAHPLKKAKLTGLAPLTIS
jgi:hypothetical protein